MITLDIDAQYLKWNQRRIEVDGTKIMIKSGPQINPLCKNEVNPEFYFV